MDMSEISTVSLEIRRIAAQVGISGHMLDQMRLDEVREVRTFAANDLVMQLRSEVWAHNLPPEKVEAEKTLTIDVPASWWQHLKQEHADTWWLGWLVRRRPPVVRQESRTAVLTVNLARFRVYPDAPSLPASYGRHYAAHVVEQRAWWRDA